MLVSISFSSEAAINREGFSLIPIEFSTMGYSLAFANPERIIRAYFVTVAQATLGTSLGIMVAALVAYPLSRNGFIFRKPIMFYIFFTMLFSGGLIPSYIINTQWYGLGNSFWIYILPGMAGGAWNTIILRTFFKSLPEELFFSAKVDGATELKIFFSILLPLSKPVLATLGFMSLVAYWNNWMTTLIYIRDSDLFTLQFLLQRILNEAQFLRNMATNPPEGMTVDMLRANLPVESLRYAMVVIAAGPMLVIFPFFQKYFTRGLIIGAIKG
jgi:putative aldouronate transport system permease protein